MKQLNPIEVPLNQGRYLIQASAGTGKTWTISLLYLRLLIELNDDTELNVNHILVVTYTRAATDELRERILQRLRIAVRLYEDPDKYDASNMDQEYLDLLKKYPPNSNILLILKRALLNFDEAAVYTIHGFCQRALKENAFDVSMPFESEMISDEQSLLLALCDQFWHRNMLNPDSVYTGLLRSKALTPDSLLAAVRSYIGRPYLKVKAPKALSDELFEQVQDELQKSLVEIGKSWLQYKTEIPQICETGVLNKGTFKEPVFKAFYTTLEKLSQGSIPSDWKTGLEKFTSTNLQSKTKKNQVVPEHAIFNQIEKLLTLESSLKQQHQDGYNQLLYALLSWLQEQLPIAKQRSGLMAFDDLLINLQEALKRRPSLANQLAHDYKVALIDEFQDTDPVQYEVFDQIYAQHGVLFYVGDPKQAIYSFRGADINTYLYAANGVPVEQQYTLDRNFRSDPRLIQAFNTIFSASGDPFRNQQQVTYEQVQAGKGEVAPLVAKGIKKPFRFWLWQESHVEMPVNKKGLVQSPAPGEVMNQIADATAREIAQLLIDGQKGEALINGEPVQSSDIAILVRKHDQGLLIKQALQRYGIVSVQKSNESIFQTHEALELRFLLDAIIEPSNERKLRRAVVGDLLGGTSTSLQTLDEQPDKLERLIEHFHSWRNTWQKHGFMAMCRQWLRSESFAHSDEEQTCYAYILSFVDGERRLTNLLHLAELTHSEIRREAMSMQSVLRWLTSCRKQAEASKNEENQLRLESDDDLVQIVTIHKSKGLQYPIVYCPFLWNDTVPSTPRGWFTWYDTDSRISCLQANDEDYEEAVAQWKEEEESEALRLLYVALTRAQYHCSLVVPTGAVSGFSYNAAVYWLLFGHLESAKAIMSSASSSNRKQLKQDHQLVLEQQLNQFVDESGQTIECITLPEPTAETQNLYFEPQHEQQTPRLCEFNFQQVPSLSRVGSFSGLTHGHYDEKPDYDVLELQPKATQHIDYREFPAGAKAGECLHKILERLAFNRTLDELDHAQKTQRETVVERTLLEFGYELEYVEAAERLIHKALYTPLYPSPDLCLHVIDQCERLDEMEFHFPVTHLKVEELKQVLHEELPEKWYAIHDAVERLSFHALKGYMKGFIDLIFVKEGLYYIVDYKSNRLAETEREYDEMRMREAVADAHYYLQYLIYSVALHRYLSLRLGEEYSWETHIGGVYYLFIRGMSEQTEGKTGVYYHLPSESLIERLSQLMQG